MAFPCLHMSFLRIYFYEDFRNIFTELEQL